jgi:nucleotide sugar dehydrogenase
LTLDSASRGRAASEQRTVAVVGLGKIGLPLAVKYASAGWRAIGIDVRHDIVDAVRSGRSTLPDEPDVEDLLSSAHRAGLLTATTDHRAAVRSADVVVVVVPLKLTSTRSPDYSSIDAATAAIAGGLRASTLVIYETTLPIGDTRGRFGPILAEGSGMRPGGGDEGFYLAYSPERVYSGRILHDLDTYPKLVGGVDAASARQAVEFYRSVLTADVWDLHTCETAEFAKLAETTYRDVNIALANEFAHVADTVGVDILEVIRAANSQPYSHIHQPGLGVGGHCIPVYPHFLLSGGYDVSLARRSREVNDDQVRRAIREMELRIGDLRGTPVTVLGVTYREGVAELAYSRGVELIDQLLARGAIVSAYDPLIAADDLGRLGAIPYAWGAISDVHAIVTQTADPLWRTLEPAWFPRLRLLYDGRNSLEHLASGGTFDHVGVGRGPDRSAGVTTDRGRAAAR